MNRIKLLPIIIALCLLSGCLPQAIVGAETPDVHEVSSISPAPTPSPNPSPSPPPTVPIPTPSPQLHFNYETRAREIMRDMSLFEKICQMLIVKPDDLTGRLQEIEYGEELKNALESYPVGGIILMGANMTSSEQATAMIDACQEYSKLSPFISVDEEGGNVARVGPLLGKELEPMYEYRSQGASRAYENAAFIAGYIKNLGFNLVFAPVADVWTNEENTVIGDRAYSDDPLEASMLVSSAVKGFQDQGIISTLKHFPGHGDTSEDTHHGSAYSRKTLDEMRQCEFLPFIAGIDAGVEAVMTSHVIFPNLDENAPATFSEFIITGILRDDLGFEGVILTDALGMKALSVYSPAEVAVMAVEAGTDILLSAVDIQAVVSLIEERIPEERINESVIRILSLKLKYGIIE